MTTLIINKSVINQQVKIKQSCVNLIYQEILDIFPVTPVRPSHQMYNIKKG